MTKVSVIVPVYNASDYLDRCVKSILNQVFNDLELILVDDGSTDDSPYICDKWSNCDSRVKTIHKLNEGVSSARNIGIDESSGDWLMFVDADDSICPETIKECSKFFDDFDIIRFEAIDSFGNIMTLPNIASNLYLKQILERRSFLAIWGGLYKKEIFDIDNIRFNTKLKYGEDWAVLIDLLSNTNNVKLLHNPLYLYNNQNESSFLNTMSFNKLENLIIAFSVICEKSKIQAYSNSLNNTRNNLYYTSISTCIKNDENINDLNYHINRLFAICKEISLYDIFCSNIKLERKLALLLYRSKYWRFFLYYILRKLN